MTRPTPRSTRTYPLFPSTTLFRSRLSWFSPVTDNALFVNQRGQRVGEHSIDSLARMVAAGQARIVTAARGRLVDRAWQAAVRSEEHTSELQSLMRISYAVFCLKKKNTSNENRYKVMFTLLR